MTEHLTGLPRLYSEFAEWWPLVSPPADYEAEAEHHWRVLGRYAQRPIETMLELGCGGGNNASFLKHHFRMTLVDLSPHMLEVSRRLNPECEHVEGDMRSIRLRGGGGITRTFDAVLVHDAIMYMRSEDELRQVFQTAFEHCAPGGVALFVPDYVRETWVESTGRGGHDGPDGRAIRFLDWTMDPDPADTEFIVEVAYLLRLADGSIHFERDRHRFGLFPTDTWLRSLNEVGLQAHVERCDYAGAERARSFVGLRGEQRSDGEFLRSRWGPGQQGPRG